MFKYAYFSTNQDEVVKSQKLVIQVKAGEVPFRVYPEPIVITGFPPSRE